MEVSDAVARLRDLVRADIAAGGARPLATYLRIFGRRHQAELTAEYQRLVVPGTLLRPATGATPAEHETRDEPASAPANHLPAPTPGEGVPAAARDRPASQGPASALPPLGVPVVEHGEIARGGMGAILRVREEALGRELAMKVILGDGAAPPETVARFVDEARVQAQLDHPGVVPVHHLGVDGTGRICFTMKLVRGRSLAEIGAQVKKGAERANITRAVQVVLRVCETMAYAHDKGVIHRDLKPANVMVGGFGEVYVMDWGLSKVLGTPERPSPSPSNEASAQRTKETADGVLIEPSADAFGSGRTQAGSVLGTPAYMPPEQARGDLAHVDARSDVYAIGAILYEVIARRAPYSKGSTPQAPLETLVAVHAGPPEPLAKLAPPGLDELVAVVEKAMAREPAARYPSARELGDDLQRWIEGRVVRAHRTGAWAEARKWVQRNRGIALSLLALVAVLAAAWLRFTLLEMDAKMEIAAERDEAVAARRFADRAARRSEGQRLCTIAGTLAEKDPTLAALIALEGAERAPGPEATTALYAALASMGEAHTLIGHDEYVMAGVWSPDGRRVWTAGHEGRLIAWDTATGRELARVHAHQNVPLLLRLVPRPGGTSALLTAAADGTIRLSDPETLAAVAEWSASPAVVFDAAASADGSRVAVAGRDGIARVVDVATGRELAQFAGHGAPVARVAWSPDGRRIASGGADFHVRVWDAATGAAVADLACAEESAPAWDEGAVNPGWLDTTGGAFPAAAWSADGTRLITWVAAKRDGQPKGALEARVWDAGTAALLLRGPAGVPWSTFDGMLGDGRTALVSVPRAGAPGEQTLLDLGTGALRPLPWKDGTAAERLLRASPDGRLVATVGERDVVLLRDVATGAVVRTFRGHRYSVRDMAFSPDGRRLLTSSHDMTARIWDVESDSVRRGITRRGDVESLCMDAEGQRVAVRWKGGPGVLADPADGTTAFEAPGVSLVTISADGRRAAGTRGDALVVVDVATGKDVWSIAASAPRSVELDETGRWVGWRVQDQRQTVFVKEVDAPGEPRRLEHPEPSGPEVEIGSIAIARGGRLVAGTLGFQGAIVWDVASGKAIRVFRGHTGFVHTLAFAPSGNVLATQAQDSSVQLWDVERGRNAGRFSGLPFKRGCLAFGADGSVLAMANVELAVVIDTATVREIGRIPTAGNGYWDVQVAKDGSIVTMSRDGSVRRWPADAAAWMRERLPRELTMLELDQYQVGTTEERATREHARVLRSTNPRDAHAATRLVLGLGRGDAAAELAARALAVDPDDPYSHLAQAAVDGYSQRIDAMFASLRRARDLGLSPQRLDAESLFAKFHDDPRWKELAGGN